MSKPASGPGDGTQAYCRLDPSQRPPFDHERSFVYRAAWELVSALIFENGFFPFYSLKVFMLRLFGARIGADVLVKPRARIKEPWHLEIGDYCYLGEDAWIDNLGLVRIGNHVCISQGAYICTGSHDIRRRPFPVVAKPIVIETGAWVAARAIVLQGVCVGSNAIVSAGAVVREDVPAAAVVAGNPAIKVAERQRPES